MYDLFIPFDKHSGPHSIIFLEFAAGQSKMVPGPDFGHPWSKAKHIQSICILKYMPQFLSQIE